MKVTDGRLEFETVCETCGETCSCDTACECGKKMCGMVSAKPLRGTRYHNMIVDDIIMSAVETGDDNEDDQS